ITMPFMGLPAWADACVTAPVSTYTAPGFSCSVGDPTFSNFATFSDFTVGVSPRAGDVNFDVISPFIRGNEFGLQLSLLANLGPGLGATLTIEWDYTVSKSGRPSIHDAFLQLDGNTGGDGVNMVNETVHTDGTFIDTLHLGGPGTTTLTFDDLLGRL